MRAQRKDVNHSDLVCLIRRLGGQWEEGGPVDGWLGKDGKWTPTEFKDPKREGQVNEYTDAQHRFFLRCAILKNPYLVIRTADDVLKYLNPRKSDG